MTIEVSTTNETIEVSTSGQTVNATVGGGQGPQGATGATGATGPAGPTGPSGVVSATAPLAYDAETKTVSISVGTTSGTVAAGNDSRLSDAREWTAETVSQAEAETGTSSTRRAFTAARVFQAIAAWWAGSAAKTKLDGIASGATANQTDAHLLARANHTGTQAISTVSGLQDALDGKQASGSYATLVNGTVPSVQLPSYVDDVIEAANVAGLPVTGETGKIYVALDTGKVYRWSGSAYVEISPSPGSTDAVPEGSSNLYHTTARAAAAAPVQSVAGRTGTVTLAVADVSNAVSDSDARLSDARTPTSHAHGNITNAGAIGTTASLPVITTTSGVLTTGSFGTSSGTFCQGNDSRLSDSRSPTAHKTSHATGGTDAISPTDIGAQKTITTGTAAPSGGADGDIYLRYS